MRITIATLLISCLALSGCTTVRDSNFNPLNWFGRAQPAPVAAQKENVNPLIPRRRGLFAARREALKAINFTTPIATITELRVERVPGGAIIRAMGVDSRQGAFNVDLIPVVEDEVPVDGVLAYTFERQTPSFRTATGPAQTREVVVARHVTDQQLVGVRTIRVEAAQNALQTRR